MVYQEKSARAWALIGRSASADLPMAGGVAEKRDRHAGEQGERDADPGAAIHGSAIERAGPSHRQGRLRMVGCTAPRGRWHDRGGLTHPTAAGQSGCTCAACGPLAPWVTSNCTR